MISNLISDAAVSTFHSNGVQAKDFDPTGWELALVTTPSGNLSSANERQLVCFNVIVNFEPYRFPVLHLAGGTFMN